MLFRSRTFTQAAQATRTECIFTTHTPVEAGHDRFSANLMGFAGRKFEETLGLSAEEVMDLGRVQQGNLQEPFCMTVLALRYSRAANGVSELHGQVSREMWHCLYPQGTVPEVPIGHITNGIHLMGWMKGPVRRYWRRKLAATARAGGDAPQGEAADRKSTRLNSSHSQQSRMPSSA